MTVDDIVEQFPLQVGRRVRESRTARGLTLDDLAELSSVSRRMIINVESGASNPSIATLLRLATALHVSLAELVSPEPESAGIVITRNGTRAPLWRGPKGGRAVMVTSADTPDMFELWDWTMKPAESYESEAHPAGTWELIHVLAGTLRLAVNGQTYVLNEGDATSFEGNVPHSYSAAGRHILRFTMSVSEPKPRVRP